MPLKIRDIECISFSWVRISQTDIQSLNRKNTIAGKLTAWRRQTKQNEIIFNEQLYTIYAKTTDQFPHYLIY